MITLIKQHPTILKALKQYEMLPSRDRIALKTLGFVSILMFMYFALWQPAYLYKKESQSYLQQQKELLAMVIENKLALRGLTSSSSSNTSALNSQQLVTSVTNLAKQTGVVLKRFEPSGEREIKVWVDDASFDKMIIWLTTMKRTLNVRVEQISVEKSDGPGLVSARLTLSS
ncbi:MAG: general secretion pathway protein M [Oleiphilaceae bacterium]|jgi:general secretion pathway protein M